LIELFEKMPCELADPEMTPEQQAAYDKQVAWEEANRKELEEAIAQLNSQAK
jgi:hypothetical protein